MSRRTLPDSVADRRTAAKAPWLALAGGVLFLLSGLLSWSYDDRILGDLSIRFYPAGIQLYAMLLGVIALILGRAAHAAAPVARARRAACASSASPGSCSSSGSSLSRSPYQSGGLVNANEGGWVALVGAVLADRRRATSPRRSTSTYAPGHG